MRPDRIAFGMLLLGAWLATVPAAASEPQKPPVEPGAKAAPPTPATTPAPAQQEVRPAPAPAPFRPAESVSPSRKLSIPNDM